MEEKSELIPRKPDWQSNRKTGFSAWENETKKEKRPYLVVVGPDGQKIYLNKVPL